MNISQGVKDILIGAVLVVATCFVVFLISCGVMALAPDRWAAFFMFTLPMGWVCFLTGFFFVWMKR